MALAVWPRHNVLVRMFLHSKTTASLLAAAALLSLFDGCTRASEPSADSQPATAEEPDPYPPAIRPCLKAKALMDFYGIEVRLVAVTEFADGTCGLYVEFQSDEDIASFRAQRRQNGLPTDAHPHAGKLIPLDLTLDPPLPRF